MTPEKIRARAIPTFSWLSRSRWRGHTAYRSYDAIYSLALGVISRIVAVFIRVLRVGIYARVRAAAGRVILPASGV